MLSSGLANWGHCRGVPLGMYGGIVGRQHCDVREVELHPQMGLPGKCGIDDGDTSTGVNEDGGCLQRFVSPEVCGEY